MSPIGDIYLTTSCTKENLIDGTRFDRDKKYNISPGVDARTYMYRYDIREWAKCWPTARERPKHRCIRSRICSGRGISSPNSGAYFPTSSNERIFPRPPISRCGQEFVMAGRGRDDSRAARTRELQNRPRGRRSPRLLFLSVARRPDIQYRRTFLSLRKTAVLPRARPTAEARPCVLHDHPQYEKRALTVVRRTYIRGMFNHRLAAAGSAARTRSKYQIKYTGCTVKSASELKGGFSTEK